MKIAITGCGPSGLSTAIALCKQGHEVELFEQFESAQPLGSGIVLQPTGLTVLKALGCHDAISERGHAIYTMTGNSMPSNKRVLNVDYGSLGQGIHGLAVHRAALFEVLYERAIKLGIAITTATRITDLDMGDDQISLIDTTGHRHGPFDLCVDASGANSLLHAHAPNPVNRRWLKFGAVWGSLDWPEQGFRQHVLDQRYVDAHTMIGVLPIGRHSGVNRDQVAFFWSLPVESYSTWQSQGLEHWKSKVLGIWPETDVLLDQITSAEQMTLARYGHHTLRTPYNRRLVFIGDAAHSTSPQLGQGANMGLLDAMALAYALGECSTGPTTMGHIDRSLQHYAKIRRTHVRLFQLASLSLTPFYQSDSRALARLRDLFFDPMSRLPVVRRLVAGLVTGLLANPLGRMGLSTDSISSS